MIGEIPCAECGCTEPQHTDHRWLAAKKVCLQFTPIPTQEIDEVYRGGLNEWIWRAQHAEADLDKLRLVVEGGL